MFQIDHYLRYTYAKTSSFKVMNVRSTFSESKHATVMTIITFLRWPTGFFPSHFTKPLFVTGILGFGGYIYAIRKFPRDHMVGGFSPSLSKSWNLAPPSRHVHETHMLFFWLRNYTPKVFFHASPENDGNVSKFGSSTKLPGVGPDGQVKQQFVRLPAPIQKN